MKINNKMDKEERADHSEQTIAGHILIAIDIVRQETGFEVPKYIALQIADMAADDIWCNLEDKDSNCTLACLTHAYCQDKTTIIGKQDKSAN